MCDIDKVNKQIIIMGIIGIVFSLLGFLAYGMYALIFLVSIPLGCSIMFIITKHSAYGIVYTVLFLLNRITPKGTLLGYIIIFAFMAFFIYVDRQSILRMKELKKKSE